MARQQMREGDRVVFTLPNGERSETTVSFVSGAYKTELARRTLRRCPKCGCSTTASVHSCKRQF